MNKLTELANKYNCDKGTVAYEAHGYTEEYEKIIPERGKYGLLEIGIWHGDSLRMWNEYNPDLYIDAIDIDPNVRHYIQENNRIHIYIGDQSEPEFLDRVTYLRKYNFIIDDGSHNTRDIINSFEFLWSCLDDRGYYCIEDLHASQANRTEIYNAIRKRVEKKQMKWYLNDKLLIIEK